MGDVDRADLFSVPIDAPFKADLAITYDCTNDCPDCYNEVDRLGLEMMPAEKWKQVIDRLCEVGVPHLIFTGGEATLHPDLPEIIRYADSRGPICGLNTNGRRLSHSSYVDSLLSAGLNHVQVTLGSHIPNVHDRIMNAHAFDQTVRGIENALKQGLHTITNTTLMWMNADHIEETIQFIHDFGIRTFAVNGMIYSGGGAANEQAIPESEMASFLIGIRDQARALGMRFLWYTPTQYCQLSPVELDIGAKRCNAGEYSLCVEPNADVLPCQSHYTSARNLLRDAAGDLLDRLAGAGLDYVVLPWAVTAELNRTLIGLEVEQFADVLRRIQALEMTPVFEIPLFEQSVEALEDELPAWIARGITNFEVFALASPPTTPQADDLSSPPSIASTASGRLGDGGGSTASGRLGEEGSGAFDRDGRILSDLQPLKPQSLRQIAFWIDDLTAEHPISISWLPTVEVADHAAVVRQAREGPRTGSRFSVRIERDGTVVPSTGPCIATGNLMVDSWETIWQHQAFDAIRRRRMSVVYCDQCPRLGVCATGCPSDPQFWATPQGWSSKQQTKSPPRGESP